MTVSLSPGNTRELGVAVQSAQGTAAAAPTRSLRLTAIGLDPGRQLTPLPETDSSSQAPTPVVVGAQPGGTFGNWLRPNDCDQLLYALMGSKSTSGSTNYTHTLTPSVTTPWLTTWDTVPSLSTTKYTDSRVVSTTISGQSGQGIQAEWTLAALSALVGQSAPTFPAFSTDIAMTYPQVAVTRGGSHVGDVDAFSITIDRGGQYFFGDNGLSPVDRPNGLFAVTGSFTLAFQNSQEYQAFNTGATTGTALTTTLYGQSLSLLIQIDTNTSITFASSGITYTAYPIGMDTGGAPYTVAAAWATTNQATFANNMTVTVKNQNANPAA